MNTNYLIPRRKGSDEASPEPNKSSDGEKVVLTPLPLRKRARLDFQDDISSRLYGTPIERRIIDDQKVAPQFLNEIWKIIIGFGALESILNLRLVSWRLEKLTEVSLSEKAVVQFDSSKQNQFIFATTANTGICINIDLCQLLSLNSDTQIQSISKDKLKIRLRIVDYNYINSLMKVDLA